MIQIIRDRQNLCPLQRVKDVRQIVGAGGADEKNVAFFQIGITRCLPGADGMADLPDDDRVTIDVFVCDDAFAVAVKWVAAQHADDQWRVGACKGGVRPFDKFPKIIQERGIDPIIGLAALLRLCRPAAQQRRRQQQNEQQAGPALLRKP